MSICFDKSEAVKRMQARKKQSISWTLLGLIVEYQYIPATSARNYDGSAAGDGQDPNRIILQRIVWRNGEAPRYTNFW